MARTPKTSSSALEKARAVPWAVLLQGVLVVGRRWNALSAGERERIKELLAESGGRINTLGAKQRKELTKLAGKLDVKGMVSELVALRVALRGGRRRGRRRGA